MNTAAKKAAWTVRSAADLYGIPDWGRGLFGVSERGEVTVSLSEGDCTRDWSLLAIAKGLQERGIDLPVLLRFGNVLDSRVELLNETFARVMADEGYEGSYRGVYPIKVNQQEQVVGEVTRFGRRYHHGLEAGSKAELVAALATLDDPLAYIVCNGYKDREFIDLALYGQKLGMQTVLVLEMPGEAELILERADELGVEPCIGVRARLASEGSGRWLASCGDRSVFGLSSQQLIAVVDALRERDKLHCLRMLHCHLGSQIPRIRTVRTGVTEAMRIYVDLVREGAPMGLLDVGGGLAVDYDGTHTGTASSANYSVEEYCADLVEVVSMACREAGVAHPVLMTESGRSLVAYSSVLLFNILDTWTSNAVLDTADIPEDAHEFVGNLLWVYGALADHSIQECYHDAVYYRDQLRARFVLGEVELRERALGERIFSAILARIAEQARSMVYVPDELKGLDSALSDVYYGNLSIFQSLPDVWAIDQYFPIMPIHRLDEEPVRNGFIVDCTCDSDGKIESFKVRRQTRKSIPLHEVRNGDLYVLGAFLVGAYQETLGDLHNLFGDTNVVAVRMDAGGRIQYSQEIEGDSVADVLSYVEYDPKALMSAFRRVAERAVEEGRVTARERRAIVDAFADGLRGYTYYES